MEIETDNKKSVKGRIVTAAWQLFYEKGYNGTTVDDIIELSGTSKGSFYYYFSSKDSLLDTLSTILDENYAKRLMSVINDDNDIPYNAQVFTQEQELDKYLQDKKADLLMICEGAYEYDATRTGNKTVVL